MNKFILETIWYSRNKTVKAEINVLTYFIISKATTKVLNLKIYYFSIDISKQTTTIFNYTQRELENGQR